MSECTVDSNDRLLLSPRLIVTPLKSVKTRLIKQHFALPAIGHPGAAKMYKI
jgi:hypothetical protein